MRLRGRCDDAFWSAEATVTVRGALNISALAAQHLSLTVATPTGAASGIPTLGPVTLLSLGGAPLMLGRFAARRGVRRAG